MRFIREFSAAAVPPDWQKVLLYGAGLSGFVAFGGGYLATQSFSVASGLFAAMWLGWILAMVKMTAPEAASAKPDPQRLVSVSEVEDRLKVQEEATREVLGHLAEEFEKQLELASGELRQTRELLADAIEILSDSFTSIHARVHAYRSFGPESAGNDGGSDPVAVREVEVERLIAVRLDEELDKAVRSLQFQDLTNQLLEHCNGRIHRMQNALGGIRRAAVEHLDLVNCLEASREAVVEHVVVPDQAKSSPVRHGEMAAGDIDLF